ncbi:hypothetical protein LY474_04395 [Myxococcus stipitatus]|uniref:hypothetical protein n=1 Tax=Myxococcus stipitatus TaxID=83455 RepID=UPI001F3FEEE1|nr:hypothetical protein [Myxococcus stipitatus]MCE9667047.1 hypothetical protein [Myxococcus stipitatus]
MRRPALTRWTDAADERALKALTTNEQFRILADICNPEPPANHSAFSEPCKYGLYTYGRYYTKYIRFRVLDANTYVSNYVEDQFLCWTPNP